MKIVYLAALFLFASLPFAFLLATPSSAATIHQGNAANQPLALPATIRGVTNTNDSGVGSLRQTLADALPGDTIIFSLTLPNTITLLYGYLGISQNLTISGPITPSLLTIDGNNSDRVFYIVGGNVSISGLTIRNGNAGQFGDGGGIYNTTSLTLTNSIVISNAAGINGGGIYHGGAMLTINSVSVISNTSSQGGGMRSDGVMMLTNTTFMSNTASASGGGLENFAPATLVSVTIRNNQAVNGAGLFTSIAPMTITNSSIISNLASSNGGGISTSGPLAIIDSSILSNTAVSSDGGGIVNNAGSLWLINATLSGNSATNGSGGGLVSYNSGINFLTNVTIYTNTASVGGGIDLFTPSVTLSNTILASNIGGNCDGSPVTSAGHNLDSANTCAFVAAGDLPNTNPFLGPLANNGGLTLTHALLPGSPAIDHGTNSGCPSIDQRGAARPRTAANPCDIGAYEAEYLFLPLIKK